MFMGSAEAPVLRPFRHFGDFTKFEGVVGTSEWHSPISCTRQCNQKFDLMERVRQSIYSVTPSLMCDSKRHTLQYKNIM
jgi:hypothetical protein